MRANRWIAFALMLLSSHAQALTPESFTVQGVLRDGSGTLQSIMVNVTVSLYTTQTGGSAFATYPLGMLGAQNGLFTATVNDATLVAKITQNSSVWLELTVTGVGLGGTFPRQPVAADLFAIEAATADALNCTGCITDAMIPANTITGDKINGAVPLSTSTAQIQSVPVSMTAPTSGQVLEYNGSSWVPASISAAGLTGVVPIANGGTGSATQNFVDLTTDQTVGGRKSFTAAMSVTSGSSGNFPLTVTQSAGGASADSAVLVLGGATTGVFGGDGIITVGGDGAAGAGGYGLRATGGTGTGPNGGGGIVAIGGAGTTGQGGAALFATGGAGTSGNGGIGIIAQAGSSTNGAALAAISATSAQGAGGVYGDAAQFSGTVRVSPNGGSRAFIDFGAFANTVGPPGNGSPGWKIKLYDGAQQYGFGIEAGTLWYSANSVHKWLTTDGTNYTQQMTLDSTGQLSMNGRLQVGATNHGGQVSVDAQGGSNGIVAFSPNSIGVVGTGIRGVLGTSLAAGTAAIEGDAAPGGIAGLFLGAVDVQGNLSVAGTLSVTGTKMFVDPHPNDPTKEIAFIALEGPEAGTYCRGSARLRGERVTIRLPESFSLVTAAEGVTAQITPVGRGTGLYVAHRSPRTLEIACDQGRRCPMEFDWFVQGVRERFRDHQAIRDRQVHVSRR